MNIQAQKIELAQLIFNTNDKSVLKKIKEALMSSQPDLMDELHDDVKADVLISIQELKEGKGIPHETVMKKIRKWQNK